MICPHSDCPVAFRARALEHYREEHGITSSAQELQCEHCERCNGKLVCWERRVIIAKDGTRTTELRAKPQSEWGAA